MKRGGSSNIDKLPELPRRSPETRLDPHQYSFDHRQ
jgi:hypothetical protein